MKKFFFVVLFAFTVFNSCQKNEPKTTYYLIRHAEKDKTDTTNRNPNLNKKGLNRAENWADYFSTIDLDAVYSTNYNRTLQTAKPTAQSKNLTTIIYNPRKLYDSIFQQKTKGKTVLIVGHSNTTPAFTNKILGKKKYSNIDENDNSKLFIVTIDGEKVFSDVKSVEL
jgi:broad specificity phosphatase PhoE